MAGTFTSERTRKRTATTSIIGGTQSPLSRSLRDELLELLEDADWQLRDIQAFFRGTFAAAEVKAAVDLLLSQGRVEAWPDHAGGRIIGRPICGSAVAP